MPLPVRAKGVSLSTATNWAFNWIVGEVTPYLQEAIAWRLYPMHGFFCIFSFVLGLLYFIYGSTTGADLFTLFVYSLLLWVLCFSLKFITDLLQCILKRKEYRWKKWMQFSVKVCPVSLL